MSQSAVDRDVYARDLWPRLTLEVAAGLPPRDRPAAVVWTDSAAQVAQVIRICARHGVPLVPYGAGSGVGGGAVGPAGSLVLDTKRMRAVHIDRAAGTVTCEPGVLGWHLEEQLARRGLTLGHFPSSIMCSTVGGWVATRGAGQCSTKYGKIEDMVRSLEVVSGDGRILRVENGDRGGLDWVQGFVGSEGVLGVVTAITATVRPVPEARRLRGFAFPSVEAGCQAIRHLMQRGMRPAVVRLYDEIDTLIAGAGRGARHGGAAGRLSDAPSGGKGGGLLRDLLAGVLGRAAQGGQGIDVEELLRFVRPDADRVRGRVERWLLQTALGETDSVNRAIDRVMERLGAECLLILGFEGDGRIVDSEDRYACEQMAHCGGRDLGEEPGQNWLRHRYDVSFKMSRVFRAGAFSDTVEVATTWDRLLPLYRQVRTAVAPHALIMAHFSHAYVDGCSIYFTVMANRRTAWAKSPAQRAGALADDQHRYDELWGDAMRAALRAGAAISHHHGVGRLKTPFLGRDQGAGQGLLVALKRACDPHNICNQGNLVDVHAPTPRGVGVAAAGGDAAGAGGTDENFLRTYDADVSLRDLEQGLRAAGLTLGGLPAWAWGRTLGAALLAPQAADAALGAGRLRDRVAQIVAQPVRGSRLAASAGPTSGDGTQALVVPPHPAPRRATGPDVAPLLLSSIAAQPQATLGRVTVRVRPLPGAGAWLGCTFADAAGAVRALGHARTLHGCVGLEDVVLLSREACGHVAGTADLLGRAAYVLLARGAAPQAIAEPLLRALRQNIGDDALSSALPAELCRALWDVDSRPVLAAPPAVQLAVDDSPAALTALLAGTVGPRFLCGVYLHGVAYAADASPPALFAAARPSVSGGAIADDAHAVLWPRLLGDLAPLTNLHTGE